MMQRPGRLLKDIAWLIRMPRVTVSLAGSQAAGNHPFYGQLVGDWYRAAARRHRKLPLVRALEYGVALCELPATSEAYLMMVEPAGRRNVKKARRLGYDVGPILFNDYLEDIREIRNSADVRQGRVDDDFREVSPCTDPASKSALHDYPYFGVTKGGCLRAYAGCFVAGELCMIEHILGHAAHQSDGVVPLLIAGIADTLLARYPNVKYYAYGTFFGGGETLRRFKKKFKFLPHRVTWRLD